MENKIASLFNIKYPIIQGGMVWVSGWKLASAVSNAGGLGLIGAGSMYPEVLKTHIQKCKKATTKPFGVNVPMLYPQIEELMQIIIDEGVKIVFTSAGNPKTWTSFLKEKGITVVHVVSSVKFALKAEAAGVDAVVCEGFEAGGHNGREPAENFIALNDDAFKNLVLGELDALFENKASSSYVKHITQNWNNEPYAKGAYITDQEDYRTVAVLGQSVDSKVYFAGDAYTTGDDWSSVHAAARSAIRAVNELTK